jgi:iron complex outermembrane receptor protein
VASSTTPYPANSWGYERVEVLRGPASIVYGTGTVGATANVVRKQPTRETVREVLVGAGSHGTSRLGLGMGGALSDTVTYRVDAYGHYTNGEHDMARARGGKLMSTLRWQPTPALRLELLADVSDERPARYFGTPTVNGAIVPELLGRNFNTTDSRIRIQDQRLRARAQYQANAWLAVSNELYRFHANPATGATSRPTATCRRPNRWRSRTIWSCRTTWCKPATGWRPPSRPGRTSWSSAGKPARPNSTLPATITPAATWLA